ncbi:hypothetical protein [Aureimonas glaciei]
MPSATLNELDGRDARKLVKNGVVAVSEGANIARRARISRNSSRSSTCRI